ncbi:hypothetical protein OMP38_13255 [Cohnella ginsengisoli]|uniref:Uncharacterized protein n=1 Tax=Cohnella ginsengisoli TaxID=425004 RepID=A0A9X4KL90_9BACL|nr:hypothetical protein [Cohnella ginsengisoli]MDG0791730.1 hypothetical protein [Cohnella ginsengisoli]
MNVNSTGSLAGAADSDAAAEPAGAEPLGEALSPAALLLLFPPHAASVVDNARMRPSETDNFRLFAIDF